MTGRRHRLPPPVLAALALAALLPGSASGGFEAEPRWAARAAASGDVDGDGTTDLVIAQVLLRIGPQRGRVAVLLGDPASPGRWRSRTEVETDPNPLDLLLLDLDGNGRPDVATANGIGGTVTLLLQDAAGAFQRTDLPATARPHRLAAGDLDGDGRPDLAVAGRRDAVILLQDGALPGTFLAPQVVAAGVDPLCVAVADLDGAGGADVALGLTDAVGHLLRTGPGTFAPLVRVDVPGRDPEGLAATDLDGDGRTDFACALRGLPYAGGGQGLAVLLQDPAGGMVFEDALVGPRRPYDGLHVVDLEGDGVPDLLATSGRRVYAFRQDPADRGRFRRGPRRAVTAAEGAVAPGDFDGDGVLDLAASFFRPFLVRQDLSHPRRFRRPFPFRES